MLFKGTKYTALEILTEAGFEKPEEIFGKFGIKISGISGIVSPDHIVLISLGSEKLIVSAKGESKEIELGETSETNTQKSEGAEKAIKEKFAARKENEIKKKEEIKKEEEAESEIEE